MKHPTPSFGWVVQEASRAGNLDVDAAQALGVTPGPAFNELKSGLPVVNPLGEVIAPEMVVSPDRPGRRVALIGRTADARGALRLAHRADLLVHDACCLAADEPAALAGGRCSARMAGQFARQVDAAHLLLTSIGQQFDSSGAPECSVEQLEREAGDAFGRPAAALEDLQVWDLSRKEPSS